MSVRGPPSTSASATQAHHPGGLVVQVGNGYERMVMSDQEICDDVLATIPKLKAAAIKDTFGRRWKQRKRKNGVDMFELAPGGGDDPDDDLDIAHALVAKTELRCHLNEVLNVLINPQSSDYEAAMQSLCGSKFKRGQVLFTQRRKFQFRTSRDTATTTASTSLDASGAGEEPPANLPQDGLIGVQLATLRPKLRVKMSTKHKRTQRLVFASCTQQYPSKDRAIHVMKTIPKDAHDQVVPGQDRAALRRELDHLAVGFDIQSKHNGYGSINSTTRVFLHTYASTVPPSHYGRYGRKNPSAHNVVSAADLGRRREAIMNPEAHQVMDILTKSLRQFETVIRRRRFGFQTFIYFPVMYTSESSSLHSDCSICHKHFSLFRRDFFCQLCGCMVCNDCSQKYEVEARIGEIRKNRCCIQCVVRVDSCVFDDEELLPALGPVVVDSDEASWYDMPASDDDETVSVGSASSSISENLFSTDASQRSQALEMLAQLVGPTGSHQLHQPPLMTPAGPPKTVRTTSGGRSAAPKPPVAPVHHKPVDKTKQVLRDVENHLSESLRATRHHYRADDCVVYDNERDYAYAFDETATKTVSSATPLAPIPEPKKEAKRLKYIKASGVLEEKYDRAALDLLAQVAAKRLNCPIGFVSVIDESTFRAIGTYQFPEVGLILPRDENLCVHSVYAEKPMIVKNPQRDMRFAQMGCIKDLGVKFYAGFPIRAPDGSVVATLCAADMQTHNNISTKEYATMDALTKLAADLIVPKPPQAASVQRETSSFRQPSMAMRDTSPYHQHHHRSDHEAAYPRSGSGSGGGSQRGYPPSQRDEPYVVY